MKNSPLETFLLAVLAVSALFSVLFCSLYISNIREYRSLAGQVRAIEIRRNAVNALGFDAIEYSKSNPAIKPILDPFIRKTEAVSTNKPTGK